MWFLCMPSWRDRPAELQKAKSKAQNCSNLKEEANICNQLGELFSRSGKFLISIVFIIISLGNKHNSRKLAGIIHKGDVSAF